MTDAPLSRGDEVTVIAYQGQRLRRRVWEDVGPGVVLCSESEYQRAIQEGEPQLYSGFPKEDVVRVEGSEDG